MTAKERNLCRKTDRCNNNYE